MSNADRGPSHIGVSTNSIRLLIVSLPGQCRANFGTFSRRDFDKLPAERGIEVSSKRLRPYDRLCGKSHVSGWTVI
jgi:hypothetical protein